MSIREWFEVNGYLFDDKVINLVILKHKTSKISSPVANMTIYSKDAIIIFGDWILSAIRVNYPNKLHTFYIYKDNLFKNGEDSLDENAETY